MGIRATLCGRGGSCRSGVEGELHRKGSRCESGRGGKYQSS